MIGVGSGCSVMLVGDVIVVLGVDDKVGVCMKVFLKVIVWDYLVVVLDWFVGVFGCSVGKIIFRDMCSCWGLCILCGDLMYLWWFIMVLLEVFEYVVVYECVYLIEMNYLQVFWDVVVCIYFDYKLCCDWLCEYGMKLY